MAPYRSNPKLTPPPVSLVDKLGQAVTALSAYLSPNGNRVGTATSLDSLFSDDFGGAALNLTNWTVFDGGLGANPASLDLTHPVGEVLTQGAIGSGTTGITDAVANSALTISMGTTNGAERWYLSNATFAGKEDIMVIMSKTQSLTANSVMVGLVEVDPVTLLPFLNPNFAGDFTNRGGVEFGLGSTATGFQAEAVGDSSGAKSVGGAGAAVASMVTAQEYLVEIDSRDVTVSNRSVDAVTANSSSSSRVSTQCPNDMKLYKLLIRCRNVSGPGSNTNYVFQRILVIDNYEMRVQISSGEGDTIPNKAVPVCTTGAPLPTTAIGTVALQSNANLGASITSAHKLTSAATTNATSAKASPDSVVGGSLRNRAATERYFKFYNKASAPVIGTDIPMATIGIPAGGLENLGDFVGYCGLRFTLGVAYVITGAYADADATAIAAGDVDVNLIFGA